MSGPVIIQFEGGPRDGETLTVSYINGDRLLIPAPPSGVVRVDPEESYPWLGPPPPFAYQLYRHGVDRALALPESAPKLVKVYESVVVDVMIIVRGVLPPRFPYLRGGNAALQGVASEAEKGMRYHAELHLLEVLDRTITVETRPTGQFATEVVMWAWARPWTHKWARK